MQRQYVAKPTKVLAEQYLEGAALPAGVSVGTITFPFEETGGPPHCHVHGTIVLVEDTNWILMSPHHPGIVTEVLTDTEFTDRFGSTGPPL